jgi:hypothetical protein
VTTPDPGEYRARQRARAKVMALILGGLAILFFFLTLAKIGQPGV